MHTRTWILSLSVIALLLVGCHAASPLVLPSNMNLAGTYLDARDGQGQLRAELRRTGANIDGRFVLTRNAIDEQRATLAASVDGRAVTEDSMYLIIHWSKVDSGICIMTVVPTLSVKVGAARVAYVGRYWPHSISGPMSYGALLLEASTAP